jgi:hypothetical protein
VKASGERSLIFPRSLCINKNRARRGIIFKLSFAVYTLYFGRIISKEKWQIQQQQHDVFQNGLS